MLVVQSIESLSLEDVKVRKELENEKYLKRLTSSLAREGNRHGYHDVLYGLDGD